MPFSLIKDSLWGKVSELQIVASPPNSHHSQMCLCCARRRHECTKQRCLFVKAGLNKCPVLSMSLYYHSYSETPVDIFQSCHPFSIIWVWKERTRSHCMAAPHAIRNRCMHICGNFQGKYTRCFLFSFIIVVSLADPRHKNQWEKQNSQFLTTICFSFNVLNKSKKES